MQTKPPTPHSVGDPNSHAYMGDPTRFYVIEDKSGEVIVRERNSPLAIIPCRRILDGPFETKEQAIEQIPEGKKRMKIWGPVFYKEPDFGFDPTTIDWYGDSVPPKTVEATRLSTAALVDFADMESFDG